MQSHHESHSPREVADSARANAMDPLRILSRGRWTIAGCVICGLALAYLFYLRSPAVYRSTAEVLVAHRQANMALDTPEALSIKYAEEAALNTRLATHVKLLKNTGIIGKAVKDHKLNELPSLAGVGDAAATIASGISAKRATTDKAQETTNILQLTYSGTQPGDCQKILTDVLESYQVFLKESDLESNDTVSKLFSKWRDVVHAQFTQVESELAQLRKDAQGVVVTGPTGISAAEFRTSALDDQMLSLELLKKSAESNLTAVQALADKGHDRAAIMMMLATMEANVHGTRGANNTRGSEPGISDMLSSLDDTMRLAQLKAQGFGPGSVQWQEIQARIDTKEKAFGDLEGNAKKHDLLDRHTQSLKYLILACDTQMKNLRQMYNEAKAGADKAKFYRQQEEVLREQKSRLIKQEDVIFQKMSALNLNANFGGFQAQVILPPTFGVQTEPNFTRIMLAGLFFGLVVGLGSAYLMEMTDKSFHSPEEIKQRLGMAVLGHIPVLSPARPGEEALAGREGFPLPDKSLVAFHRPKSRMAEAYRAVRTALYFGAHAEKFRVVQITSPNPGDGKSTLSSNLAVSMAQSGKRVLLIDCDFRRPRVHKLFNIKSRVGMTSVLKGEAELKDAIHPTIVESLFVMPCGSKPDDPAELLTSPKFAELLATVRDQFEFVLVDTPPLLAVTDPCAVAPRVDGVILTIRVQARSRAATIRAAEMLDHLGAKLLGVVVNGVGKTVGYGEYGYDGRTLDYGYGSRYYRYGQEYYMGGATDQVNYGYDDASGPAPAKSAGPAKRNGRAAKGESSAVANGSPQNGAAADAHGPIVNDLATIERLPANPAPLAAPVHEPLPPNPEPLGTAPVHYQPLPPNPEPLGAPALREPPALAAPKLAASPLDPVVEAPPPKPSAITLPPPLNIVPQAARAEQAPRLEELMRKWSGRKTESNGPGDGAPPA